MGGRLLVPIRLDADTAHIEVQGQANASLNGVPLATSRPLLVRVFAPDVVAMVATVAAAIFGGLALLGHRQGS